MRMQRLKIIACLYALTLLVACRAQTTPPKILPSKTPVLTTPSITATPQGTSPKPNATLSPTQTAKPHFTTTFYVDPKAKVGGDGSIKKPFRYIAEAVLNANPGTRILLRGGNHILREEFEGGQDIIDPPKILHSGDMVLCDQPATAKEPIVIENAPGERPVFNTDQYPQWGANGMQRALFNITGSYYTLQGLTFIGSQKFYNNDVIAPYSRATAYIRLDDQADHITIADCTFSNGFARSAINIAGDTQNSLITNCRIHDMNAFGIFIGGRADTFVTSGATNNIIENCDIYRCAPGENNAPIPAARIWYTNHYRAGISLYNLAENTVNTVRGCRIFQNEGGGIVLHESKGKAIVDQNWIFQNGYVLQKGNKGDYTPYPTIDYTFLGQKAAQESNFEPMNSRGGITLVSETGISFHAGKVKMQAVITRNLIYGNSGFGITATEYTMEKITAPSGRIFAAQNTIIGNQEGGISSKTATQKGYEQVFWNNLVDRTVNIGKNSLSVGNGVFMGKAATGFSLMRATMADFNATLSDVKKPQNALAIAQRAKNGAFATCPVYIPKKGSNWVDTGSPIPPNGMQDIFGQRTFLGKAPDIGFAEIS